MYRYKIGYGTCEESEFVELEHEQKFNEKQITEMVAEAVKEFFPKLINESAKNKDTGEYYRFAFKFQEFWHDPKHIGIPKWLVENKGFKEMKYEVCWSAFGWASVIDKDDWNMHRSDGDELSQITDFLAEHGIKKEDFKTEKY